MRTQIRRVAGSVQGALEQVNRWFDPPLRADARPLEIREAVLDHIEARIEPVGRGRRVLPWNRVIVDVLAVDKDQRAALEAALADLDGAVRSRLTEVRCDVPTGFEARVEYTRHARGGWAPDQRFAVTFRQEAVAPPSETAAPVLELTIARGTAGQPSYVFTGRQIRIGRTSDPVDERGRPRHNDIAFVEEGDAESRTVGRGHATIRYESGRREYRLFDDGSHNGTRVVRDGAVIEVLRGDPVGVALASGDEILFGQAMARVRVG